MNVTHVVKKDVIGFSFMKKLFRENRKGPEKPDIHKLKGNIPELPAYIERNCLNILH